MNDLRLSARDVDAGYRLLEVEGELGLADADLLQRALEDEAGTAGILVGLERCEFVDSTALAALVAARRRFAGTGRRLALCGPTAQVRRVLDVTGLGETGLVYGSVEAALSDE